MKRRTRRNPTATIRDFTEGTIVPDAVSADLEGREMAVTDAGGGDVQFTLGGVNLGDPFSLPAASWSGVVGRPFVTVKEFGAVGNGVTDDSAAFTAALAAVADYGVVWIPDGDFKLTTPVTYSRTKVSIMGSGRIVGKLIVGGFGSVYDFEGRSLTGLKFSRGGASTDPTVACIELRNVMNFKISGNSFRDAGSAIYCYTEFDTARNIVDGCFYHNIGYFFRSVTGPTPEGREESAQWRSAADIHITNNNGQSNVTAVDIDSIDGAVITNNTFFSPGSHHESPVKSHNIKIGHSGWLAIADNNLFEAGLSAVQLTDPRYFFVTNNGIAQPGQRVPSDGVEIIFAERNWGVGHIGGGSIDQTTKNQVGFYGTGDIDLSLITVTPFAVARDYSATPARYYGTDPIPMPQYRIYVDPAITGPDAKMPALPPATQTGFQNSYNGLGMPDNIRGRIVGSERWLTGTIREQAMPYQAKTISGPTRLYTLLNSNGVNAFDFAGTITVFMRSTEGTASAVRTAIYNLLVSKTPVSSTDFSCALIASAGNTAGAAANHPSFTFDIEYDSGVHYLRATPVFNTSGDFRYAASATGDLRLK